MTSDPIYLLDANVFIQAARHHYAFDLAPAFWEALVNHASNGHLLSIDRVRQELERGKDELTEWANGTFQKWFASTAQTDVIEAYRKIMAWAQGQSQFSDSAKTEFAKVADGWLVAYAKPKEYVVVTHETYDPHVKRRIKIPNVCRAFQVPFIDPFEMLRALGVRLG